MPLRLLARAAAAAIKEGRLADEIVPVSPPPRRGDPAVVEHDEGVRPETTVGSLDGLRPAFDPEGTVTAGNASQLSDGASAIVLMSKAAAERRGITPLGEFLSYGMVAGPDSASLLHQPSAAIEPPCSGRSWLSPISTCSRSTRRSPPSGSLDGRPRPVGGRRQRQRRGDRPRSPDRNERQPPGPTLLHELRRRGGAPAPGVVRRGRPRRRPRRPHRRLTSPTRVCAAAGVFPADASVRKPSAGRKHSGGGREGSRT